MSNIDLLKSLWESVYDPNKEISKMFEKYFHSNYEQCINGVVLDRAQYFQHLLEQRNNVRIETIDYKHSLEKENELFSIYYIRGRNIHNNPIEAEVIAYFLFENEQLRKTHGQVRLITGDLSDIDMKETN